MPFATGLVVRACARGPGWPTRSACVMISRRLVCRERSIVRGERAHLVGGDERLVRYARPSACSRHAPSRTIAV